MDYSTPGFPVLHLPEFAPIHVHCVSDAIQPSHSLSSPSPPAFYLSQCPPPNSTDRCFPFGSDSKESACNAGDVGWEGVLQEGTATHSSILVWRIPMDRGAWRATVHGVAKSQT